MEKILSRFTGRLVKMIKMLVVNLMIIHSKIRHSEENGAEYYAQNKEAMKEK